MKNPDITNIIPIRYDQDKQPDFYRVLKSRVENAFIDKGISIKGNLIMKIKVSILIVGYFSIYFLILFSNLNSIGLILLAIAMGIFASLIGLNISHDAVHNAIFERKWLNYVLSYSFNVFLGANEYVWRITHNTVHHQYPNVPEMDPDISQTKLLRMSPADKLSWFHKFQQLYVPVVYGMFGVYLVFIKDFRVMFFMKRLGNKKRMDHPVKEYIILFVSKFIYLIYMLFIPALFFPIYQVVIGFLIVQIVIAIVFTLITAPAHVASSNKYYRPNKNGIIEQNWAIVQLETTTDFSRNSWFANTFFGGGNYQVVHHLFPSVCHIHLPWISKIVEQTAKEYGLKYHHMSLYQVLKEHIRLLSAFGKKQDPFS